MVRVTVLPAGTSGNANPFGQVTSAPLDYGDWAPAVVLGAVSEGGLMLPSATPTAGHLYGPRAAWLDDDLLVAADTGNHRVLIWHGFPGHDGAPADVVLGQIDEESEGPAAAGAGPANGLHLPTGVLVADGRLIVADAWHHRLLIWDAVPEATGTPPDHVIGQATLVDVEPNAGGEPSAATFYWPFGIGLIDGRFYVTDTGNRRVLIWRDGIPEQGRAADVVLGQPSAGDREENRGGPVSAASFRWPHAVAGDGDGGVWIADAGNHRILGWDEHPEQDRPADRVLGQPSFEAGEEFPYVPQERRFRFPYGLAAADGDLAISDTANNRVLLQPKPARQAVGGLDPTLSLGQPDLTANGENRWDAVGSDTLCWPYGVHWHRGERELLAVSDSGNNRVVLWERR
ncbi:MAG: NHL repeat-containing protein [Actinomycetia bacterium]|nr:NHL repeat-containing protein [Actinomycetes bacterium]